MKGHTMKNLTPITATIAATVVALFCGYPANAKGIPLKAGGATVGLKQTKGSTWQVDISLSKSDIYEDLLIAPLNTPVSGNRYELLRSDGKRIARAAFTITLSQQTPSQHVAVIRKNQRRIGREILQITISNDQKVSVQPVRWHSIISDISHGTDYTINMSPGVNRWLGQGHCSIQWQPAKSKTSISTIRWESSKREKIPDQFTDVPRAFLMAVPLAMNNRAVLLAEAGKYSEAEKVLEQADTIASYLGLRVDLRAVLWLNRGIFAYTAGDTRTANQCWRISMQYPKEHAGLAGAFALLVRRRMEVLQTEVMPDAGVSDLTQVNRGDPGSLRRELMGPGGSIIRPSTSEAAATRLASEATAAVSQLRPVAIGVHGNAAHLLARSPNTTKGHLLRISLKDGSLEANQTVELPSGDVWAKIVPAGIWILGRASGAATFQPQAGEAVSIPRGPLKDKQVAGAFFDGKTLWVLAVTGKKFLSKKLGATVYFASRDSKQFQKAYELTLPETVGAIVGLTFAHKGGCRVVTVEALDLTKARMAIGKGAAEHGPSLRLASGGASLVPFLQLRECATAKKVSYVAIYSLSRSQGSGGKMKVQQKSVLKDYSGKALGLTGTGARVLSTRGAPDVTSVILTRQQGWPKEGNYYSLFLVDRLLQIRGIVPVHAPSSLDQSADEPLIDISRGVLACYFHNTVYVVKVHAGDGWTPPGPDTYWPTKDRPIIHKNGRLLFGGKSGTERETMNWASPPAFQTVSPGGKLAAAVFSRKEETVVQVLNAQKKVVQTIQLVRERRTATTWISDSGHILGRIGPSPEEMRKLVQRSIYSKTHVDVPWEWFFFGTDGKRRPVDLKGLVSTVFMFADGRWVGFSYDADSGSFTLSTWREGQRLWSKEIRKKKKDATGFSMAVATRKGTPRIVVVTPDGVQEYDLEGKLKSVQD